VAVGLLRSIVAYGPLTEPIERDDVEEIYGQVRGDWADVYFVDRNGHLDNVEESVPAEELRQVVNRLLRPTGRQVDEAHPYVEAQVLDGRARLTVTREEISPEGFACFLRKYTLREETLAELERLGSITAPAAELLAAAAQAGVGTLITGRPGCGKTSLTNAPLRSLPPTQRVLVCEPTYELSARLLNGQFLKTRERRLDAKDDEVDMTMRDLVRTCLGLSPSILVIGEIRGGGGLRANAGRQRRLWRGRDRVLQQRGRRPAGTDQRPPSWPAPTYPRDMSVRCSAVPSAWSCTSTARGRAAGPRRRAAHPAPGHGDRRRPAPAGQRGLLQRGDALLPGRDRRPIDRQDARGPACPHRPGALTPEGRCVQDLLEGGAPRRRPRRPWSIPRRALLPHAGLRDGHAPADAGHGDDARGAGGAGGTRHGMAERSGLLDLVEGAWPVESYGSDVVRSQRSHAISSRPGGSSRTPLDSFSPSGRSRRSGYPRAELLAGSPLPQHERRRLAVRLAQPGARADQHDRRPHVHARRSPARVRANGLEGPPSG
jgi:type IV secretory pathway ATPase VirB11/archaellum biosynthesis ATPase